MEGNYATVIPLTPALKRTYHLSRPTSTRRTRHQQTHDSTIPGFAGFFPSTTGVLLPCPLSSKRLSFVRLFGLALGDLRLRKIQNTSYGHECVSRESNPDQLLGRQLCYRYTTHAGAKTDLPSLPTYFNSANTTPVDARLDYSRIRRLLPIHDGRSSSLSTFIETPLVRSTIWASPRRPEASKNSKHLVRTRVREPGVEPGSIAWKATMLPLYHSRRR